MYNKYRKSEDWVRHQETRLLNVDPTAENLPKEYVLGILNNYTCLNEFRHIENYNEKKLENYKSQIWNEYSLKKYLAVEYPLILLESTGVKSEYAEIVSDIVGGLLPYDIGEINAAIVLSPLNDTVIFFSESMYAFIWKYFHLKRNSNSNYAEILYKSMTKYEFLNWKTSDLKVYQQQIDAEFKLSVTLAQLFVVMHEFAHYLLGHLKQVETKLFSFASNSQAHMSYAISREDELDADMLASDLYVAFLKHSFKYNYEEFILIGFEIIRCFAKIEHDIDEKMFFKNKHHPLPSSRMIYMTLRHKQEFIKKGEAELISFLEEGIKTNREFYTYDFNKDLNSEKYMKEHEC